MHLSDVSRTRLLDYFTNLKLGFKEKVFNEFIGKSRTISVSKLRYNYVTDVRAAIATNDILFVSILIGEIHLSDVKSKAERRIKYINRQILKDSNLKYEDNTLYKLGAFGKISKVEIDNETYARKTLLNDDKSDLLLNEIKIMNDIAAYSESISQRNFCIEIIRSSRISYDMKYIDYDLEEYISIQQLDQKSKFDLIVQLNEILKNLFYMNILHRDIHPGNFLVDFYFEKPTLIISDFGLAKYIDQDTKAHDYINKYYGREKYICKKHRNNLRNCCFATELFSVGRMINFILKQDPVDRNHPLGHITSKTESLNLYNNIEDYIKDCNLIMSG